METVRVKGRIGDGPHGDVWVNIQAIEAIDANGIVLACGVRVDLDMPKDGAWLAKFLRDKDVVEEHVFK